MFSKEWCEDTLERCLYTCAETALALLGTKQFMNQIDWKMVLSATVLSGIITLLKCILLYKEDKDEQSGNSNKG